MKRHACIAKGIVSISLDNTLSTSVGMGICKCLVCLHVIACWLYHTCNYNMNRLSMVSEL